jgi:hypothetical protein
MHTSENTSRKLKKKEKEKKLKILLLLIFRRWLILIILMVVPLLIVRLDIPSNKLIRRYCVKAPKLIGNICIAFT